MDGNAMALRRGKARDRAGEAARVEAAEGRTAAPRRLASPLLRKYRRSDTAAAFAVLAAGWLAENLPAPAGAGEVLRTPVSIADVVLLLGFFWAWPLVCEAAGAYGADVVPGSVAEARRVVRAAALGTLVPAVPALLPLGDSLHPRDLLVFFPASAAAMLAVRALLRVREGRLHRRAPRKVVIAGSGPRALELWREARERPDLGIQVLGFVDDGGEAFAAATGLPRLAPLKDAERELMRLDPDEVLVTLPLKSRYADVQTLITACERTGTEARYFADVFHFSTARPRVEGASVALKTFPDDSRRLAKRALDVAVAATALVAAAPLMALVALAIRLDSPGPVLYAQERYGLHRHRFRVWKFRTMAADADARQAELEARNEADGALFKIRDDPRLTRVGRLLRRASLDELPQLWNVLRGEMSLVGPRPLPVRDVARFDEPWLMRRFSAPPGLTGLWQVQGRSAVGFDDLIAMDLQYVDGWSLGLDLRILAATVPAVVRGHGAM